MAERRMFAKTIIDSDAFLDMPLSAQALYFHLSMRADDDGFINNPKRIQRLICCSDDDLKILIAKRFILPFENGIVVIKHWRIHNYIQSDRYIETKYLDEKAMLGIKENKAYTFLSDNEDCTPLPVGRGKKNVKALPVDTACIHDGYTMETQVRLGKDSIDKSSVEEKQAKEDEEFLASMEKKTPVKKPVKKAVKTDDVLDALDSYGFSDDLREVLVDFIDMRKKKKRPLTVRALKLVVSKLDTLAKDDVTKVKIVEQSILHNWDGVFALKDDSSWGTKGNNQWDSMMVKTESDSAWGSVEHL